MRRLRPVLALALAGAAVVALAGPDDPSRGPVWRAGDYIVQIAEGTDPSAFLAGIGAERGDHLVYDGAFRGVGGTFSAAEMRRIAGDPRTLGIERDIEVSVDVDQVISPTGAETTWGIDRIDQRTGAPDGKYTYSTANDGTGVRVYVLDTGVHAAHSEFGSRVVPGWSYRSDSGLSTSFWAVRGSCKQAQYGWNVANPAESAALHPYDVDTYDTTVSAQEKGLTDNNGHGTHVAGIIAGATSGVAKDSTVVPVQALNSCGVGMASVMLASLNWILADHIGSTRAILNMSVGFSQRVGSIDCILTGTNTVTGTTCANSLTAEGISIAAAAGNSAGTSCTATPAGTPGTISIGAMTAAGTEASYTNFGPCVDILAPGSEVRSAWTAASGSPSAVLTGTSMAAPHVAGVLAQWLETAAVPASLAAWPQEAWEHLKRTSTCAAVTRYHQGSVLTPNRLLYTGGDVSVPCAPESVAASVSGTSATITWSAVASGNGADVTAYAVSAGTGQACAPSSPVPDSSGILTCTLQGLASNADHTVSVRAVNSAGAGAAATASFTVGSPPTTTTTTLPATTTTSTTTTTVPEEIVAPPGASSTSGNRTVTVTWPPVNATGAVSYLVTATPGGRMCLTTGTECTFTGLSNGVVYSISVVARLTDGTVTRASVSVKARPGFVVTLTSVARRSRTPMSRIVTSVSKGKKSYRVLAGRCRMSGSVLVAPSAKGTCKVKVSVAKKSPNPAMSTVITLRVP